MRIVLFLLSIILVFNKNFKKEKNLLNNKEQLFILPLDSVKKEYTNSVKIAIEKFYGLECIILSKSSVSSDILSKTHKKLDAKKIIEKYSSYNKRILILTQKDIALNEFGIFGLGYKPGKVSVVSTFRFSKNVKKNIVLERLNKISLHELGHNFGLHHCQNVDYSCFMKSAKHTIKTIDKEKLILCSECKRKIKLN
jgi:archaemetzincin